MPAEHGVGDGVGSAVLKRPLPHGWPGSVRPFGHLAVNGYVLHGAEPVLVEAGTVVGRDDFMQALCSVIDPADLRWLWLTHPDPDHIGAIPQLLEEAPQLRIITTFLGMGSLNLFAPLPVDGVHFVNPGESIHLADRVLTGFRPPAFDNPVSTGIVDDRTGALFSSDFFGALLPDIPERADDLDGAALRDGQVRWASIDSPWLHTVDVEWLYDRPRNSTSKVLRSGGAVADRCEPVAKSGGRW